MARKPAGRDTISLFSLCFLCSLTSVRFESVSKERGGLSVFFFLLFSFFGLFSTVVAADTHTHGHKSGGGGGRRNGANGKGTGTKDEEKEEKKKEENGRGVSDAVGKRYGREKEKKRKKENSMWGS
jgi:hypothetical protein